MVPVVLADNEGKLQEALMKFIVADEVRAALPMLNSHVAVRATSTVHPHVNCALTLSPRHPPHGEGGATSNELCMSRHCFCLKTEQPPWDRHEQRPSMARLANGATACYILEGIPIAAAQSCMPMERNSHEETKSRITQGPSRTEAAAMASRRRALHLGTVIAVAVSA